MSFLVLLRFSMPTTAAPENQLIVFFSFKRTTELLLLLSNCSSLSALTFGALLSHTQSILVVVTECRGSHCLNIACLFLSYCHCLCRVQLHPLFWNVPKSIQTLSALTSRCSSLFPHTQQRHSLPAFLLLLLL